MEIHPFVTDPVKPYPVIIETPPYPSDTPRKVCFLPADFFLPQSLSIMTSIRPVYSIVHNC